ncbi:MAG: sulfite exporter TauE/SafE family protein [Chryseotalea sp. WA131a]|nr:MAG: sulfite exporter TauE/SafE family protein [Chryseotalea sp. WA131a]
MEYFGYIAAIFIGFLLGLLGGGGSILSIPILVYIFKLDAVTASAYSLFIVGTTSLAGAVPKYRDHLVNLRTGFLFGIPSIITIFLTRKFIVPALPEIIVSFENFVITKRLFLLGLFAILMVLASVSMIRGRREIHPSRKKHNTLLIIVEGTLIGFLTGLVGAGGGFLIIPALVLLTGLPMKTATGTSLFIIALNSLTGFLGDLLNRPMDWQFLLIITSIAIVGVHFGNVMSRQISGIKLKKVFGWFTLAMGCWILVRETLLS